MSSQETPYDEVVEYRATTEAESTLGGAQVGKDASVAKIDELYRKHAQTLARSLRAQFGNGPPEPEDVVHRAFQNLLERTNAKDIQNLKAYLWQTARNLLLKDKRALQTQTRYQFEVEQLYFAIQGDDLSPSRVLLAKQQLVSINEGLRSMPQQRRTAFIMHRLKGLSVAEVARQLNLSRSAAVKHIAKAAADLDALLTDSEDGSSS
ncbi:MAG: sigma-70 family RNA polymerase sigma factor [Pseudomonadota bacterium]